MGFEPTVFASLRSALNGHPPDVQRLFISVESRFSCASGILPFAVLTVAKVLRITHFCSENRDMSAGAVWKLKLRSGRTNQIICGSFIR